MSDLHTAALRWIARALAAELADPPAAIQEHAEQLLAITEEFEVQIEELIQWIHRPERAKDLSAIAWRRVCERVAQLRAQLDPALLKENT